jgi:tetratricopeptide (TPR) repeat protein
VVPFVLVAIILFAFWPVLHCEFLTLDDPQYVTSNVAVQDGLSGSGIKWAFTAFHAGNWHPITWLSHMLDVQLFGKNPAGPHLTNLLLHLCNALLLLSLVFRFTGRYWPSAILTGLFALHPLRVESVAWISERKDLLCAFFVLLSLHCYLRYVDASKAQSRSARARYLFTVIFFVAALMSKSMAVTLPFVMLLLDYWPLNRFPQSDPGKGWVAARKLVKEKLPFFILAAAACLVAIFSQREGDAIQSLANYPFHMRAENVFVSYARYFEKSIWPVHLAMPYPYRESWPKALVGAAVLFCCGWIVGAVLSRRRYPFVTVGSFWFLGMLVPVIGLVQIGGQSMADRYTYLPQIGLWFGLIWTVATVGERLRVNKVAIMPAIIAVFVTLSLLTRYQTRFWRDTETLLRHTLDVTDANPLAWFGLGSYYDSKGNQEEAIRCYRKAVEIQPEFIRAHNSLAEDLLARGNADEAILHYREVLRLDPDVPLAHNNYGAALSQQRRFDEAIGAYRRALELDPEYSSAHYNLALILASQRRFDEAIPHYLAALRKNPAALPWNNLGVAYVALGQTDSAREAYRKAIQLDSRFAEPYVNLGNILVREGDLPSAIQNYRTALDLRPNDPAILNNLGHALARGGQWMEAINDFQEAVRVQPGFSLARYNLGCAFLAQGHAGLALAEFQRLAVSDPKNPQVHFQLARTLSAAGHQEEAMAAATEALRLKPDYAEARELLQSLKSAK